MTTFRGHFTLHGAHQAPAWYDGERVLEPWEIQEPARASGALFGLAHPHVLGNPVCCGCRLDAVVDPAGVDLLDVWSRGGVNSLADAHALRLHDQLRRSGHTPTAVCGRDWHGPDQEAASAGRAFPATLVQASPDAGEILSALARGAAYLSTGPDIDFTLHHDRGATGPGERLPPDTGQVEARIRLERQPRESLCRVLDDGKVVHQERVTGSAVAHLVCPVHALGAGVRVELLGEDGSALLLTNAIGR